MARGLKEVSAKGEIVKEALREKSLQGCGGREQEERQLARIKREREEKRKRERREKRAEGVEVGFKGSPDTAGSCIKLKLANQTRYRRNLIVILIKIATDEDSLKCELRLKRTPRESLDLSNDEGARSS